MWEHDKNMIQMNLLAKQKQTHRHRKQTYGCQREKRRKGKIGVWDEKINLTLYKIDNARSYYIAQGAIFNILK